MYFFCCKKTRVEDVVNRYGAEFVKYSEQINGADVETKIKAGEEFIETTNKFKNELNEQLFPGKAKEVETLHEMLDVAVDSTKMDLERTKNGVFPTIAPKVKTPVLAARNDAPTFDNFKETVLKQYPDMPDELIREGYNGLYRLTDNVGNDIINTNDVYYQRRETDGPQGRYNGNGNEQSGDYIESADTVRTEGYKFRDGKDYKEGRAGLWQKAYGRVSGTLKKTSPKYIRHGNRAIMFSVYDNAKSVIRQKKGSVVFYIEFLTDIYYNYKKV